MNDALPPPQQHPSPVAAVPAVVPTNATAVVSLVFGILGWSLLPVLGAIVAVVTGHMARRAIAASGGREGGDGLAVTGLVLGYVSLALLLLGAAFVLLVLFGTAGLLFGSR